MYYHVYIGGSCIAMICTIPCALNKVKVSDARYPQCAQLVARWRMGFGRYSYFMYGVEWCWIRTRWIVITQVNVSVYKGLLKTGVPHKYTVNVSVCRQDKGLLKTGVPHKYTVNVSVCRQDKGLLKTGVPHKYTVNVSVNADKIRVYWRRAPHINTQWMYLSMQTR